MKNLELDQLFSTYGYVMLAGNEEPTVASNTFSEGWHDRYFSEGFHKVDPVFHFARSSLRRSSATVLTSDEMSSPLFEEAKCFNADSNCIGVSHLGGSVLVLGAVNHDFDARNVEEVKSICQVTHRRELAGRLDFLTDNQLDILDMAEEGYLDKEIADSLGISISAVAQRKQGVCRHLGLNSFRVAVSTYSLSKWGGIVPIFNQ